MRMKRSVSTLLSAALGLSVLASGTGMAFAKAKAKDSAQPPLVVLDASTGLWQRNFNPWSTAALPCTTGLIYEGFFYINPYNGKTTPLLGTSYSWSKDSKTLTVTLRKGVKWSDGKPFTVQDVLFTFNLIRKNPTADGLGIWKNITSVSSPNANTVQFQFGRANVPFAKYILENTVILPQHIWSQVSGDPTKVTNDNPVGTGPYVLQSFSQQAYYLGANPNYWGGKPQVQTVEFPSFSGGDSADLALASGKIDWGGGFIPNIDKVYVGKDAQHRHYWFPPEAPVLIYTNNNDPILGQTAVRQAISAAINRDQLANVAEYGYEKPSSPTGLVLPNFNNWLDPSLPAQYKSFKFDPQNAEKILQKAGFKKGSDGIYQTPQGKPLEFNLNVVAGWVDWDEMATMIADDLKNIGIKVNVQQLQFGAYAAAERGGNFQMSIGGGLPGSNPFYFYNGILNPLSHSNYEKWVDGASDLALDKFQHSADPKVQKKAIYSLEKLFAEQLPSIPLVNGATWYEYDTTHFTGWPTAQNPYAEPAPYDYPAVEIVLTHLKPVK